MNQKELTNFNFSTTGGLTMTISMKLVYQYRTIFYNFSPASNHFHPLQVENCDSYSRLVVDEMVNSGLKGLNHILQFIACGCIYFQPVNIRSYHAYVYANHDHY